MIQYKITGMSCAACSARVEKAVSAVPGVSSCSVNLLTNSMVVEGQADEKDIIGAVQAAGYGAESMNDKSDSNHKAGLSTYEDLLTDTETPKMKRRLIASLCLLIPLMYMSMGHMMLGWPIPSALEGNHVAMGILQLILSSIIMVINQRFFISGFRGMIHRAPNMDTLVAMGSAASWIYSVCMLLAMTDAQMRADSSAVMSYMHEFYFESAAMILTLITVGKLLEAMSKGRTTDAIKGLMKLAPKTATVIRGGVELEIAIDDVRIGDRYIVKPGDNIPVDGIVAEGESAVDESALTGESMPVDKAVGDTVSAATTNRSGYMICEATRVGEDTTLAQIIQMVSDAAATKAPIAKIADRVSGVFVPVVITIAVITTAIWLLTGAPIGYALARGISVLVISCPCALGLATPVAIMVGSGLSAKHGIMFKTASSLEETGKVHIVALDKTGTITEGEPQITDMLPADGYTQQQLMEYAYALESCSEHPLSGAIIRRAEEMGIERKAVSAFAASAGHGLKAEIDGEEIAGGNKKYILQHTSVAQDMTEHAKEYAAEGKTVMYFSLGGRLLGLIAVADVIRKDSKKAVDELHGMGIHVVMLTGDDETTARAISAQAGVDEVVAGVLPDGKSEVIEKLKQQGSVAMVGDGINDAPALTKADIGIAIGAGTDIAIDAADVVLMHSRLSDVSAAIRLSRAVLRNIHENLFWAFIYNIIGIPLAAGAYVHILGWSMNPMVGAAAMSMSSFCVVMNALRLNLMHPDDASRDRKRNYSMASDKIVESSENNTNTQEEDKMNKVTIAVEGMMCEHCKARVEKVVSELPGVTSAKVSLEDKNVTVEYGDGVSEEDMKKAIVDAGYQA